MYLHYEFVVALRNISVKAVYDLTEVSSNNPPLVRTQSSPSKNPLCITKRCTFQSIVITVLGTSILELLLVEINLESVHHGSWLIFELLLVEINLESVHHDSWLKIELLLVEINLESVHHDSW